MKITLLSFALFFVYVCNSQTFQITNQYAIGGNSYDAAIDAVSINNNTIFGGNSLSGYSGDKTSINHGGMDIWVVSIDGNNSIEWQNSFGGNSDDQFIKIIKSLDGNLLVAASSLSGSNGNKTVPSKGGNHFWLIKLDTLGDQLWQKTYGGSGDDYLNDIIELSDGSILLVGASNSSISGDKTEDSIGQFDYWGVKIDQNGDVLWDKTIGGTSSDSGISAALDENENIYIVGSSLSSISGHKTEDNYDESQDVWIVKLDNSGTFLWDKTIGGNESEFAQNIIFSNNHLFVSSHSLSGATGTKTDTLRGFYDYWLTKLDKDGNIIMDKTYGGDNMD